MEQKNLTGNCKKLKKIDFYYYRYQYLINDNK